MGAVGGAKAAKQRTSTGEIASASAGASRAIVWLLLVLGRVRTLTYAAPLE